uniref:AAA+ ATPase domain-containing protein n=1 Tax=viral metagenome TaxID=1070528 RepID=A0A6C0LXN9_9ZZZZ
MNNDNDACIVTFTDAQVTESLVENGFSDLMANYFQPPGGAGKAKLLTKAHYFYSVGDYITAMVYTAMSLWVAKVDKRNQVGGAANMDELIMSMTRLYRSSHDKYVAQLKSQNSNKEDAPPLKIVDIDQIVDSSGQPLLFNNVVGMNTEKVLLRSKFIFPNMFPYLYTTTKNNVLMFGPPGTGKTFIAKASALEFARNGDTGIIFIEATASELRSKWEGGTEQNIKNLWVDAQAQVDKMVKDNNGRKHKAILFLDEIEALASSRTEFPENSRAVTTLLQVMDGISSDATKDVMVMAATNLPWVLDPAILRRLPGKIMVGLPDFHPRITLITEEIIKKFYNDVYNTSGNTRRSFRDRLKNATFVRMRDELQIDHPFRDDVDIRCGGGAAAEETSFDCYLALMNKLSDGRTTGETLYRSEMRRFFNSIEPRLREELWVEDGAGWKWKDVLTDPQKEKKKEYENQKTSYDALRDMATRYSTEYDFMDPKHFSNPSRFQLKEAADDNDQTTVRDNFVREALTPYKTSWNAIRDNNYFSLLKDYFDLFAMYHFGAEKRGGNIDPGMILLVKYIHYLGEQTGPSIGTRIWTYMHGNPLERYKTSRFASREFGYSNSDITNFMNDFYGRMALDIIGNKFIEENKDTCRPLCDVIKGIDCNLDERCLKVSDADGAMQFGAGGAEPLDTMFLNGAGSDIFVTYKEQTFDETMIEFFPSITSGILDVWAYNRDQQSPNTKSDKESDRVKMWSRKGF